MKHSISNLAAGAMLALALGAAPALAEGNLASKPVDLPELKLTGDLKMSETEYQLETGVYYRIDITSDGEEEFAWMSPELFRNVWVNQVVVNDLEVKAADIYSLEFDAAGTFNLTFIPLRPGRYEFYVDGYEDRGMLGAFIVN
jgi:uncharacterized cupredoxin-like copper-binding protein